MASKKNKVISTRFKKLESNFQALSFSIPPEILEWETNLTVEEMRAALAYRLTPENERKESMVDPEDVLYSRLPISAYIWAESTAKVAHELFPQALATELPKWALIAIVLTDRKQ